MTSKETNSAHKNPDDVNAEEATQDSDEKSKSQIKREKLALFDLAETLCGLPNKQLVTIKLGEDVTDIVARIRRMPMRDARRRELRFLAKQLSADDIETIDFALKQIEQGSRDQARAFHRIEQLRDQLIADPTNGISVVIAEWPEADRQLINQLGRNARKEQQKEKPPASARKLFKYLRTLAAED